MAGIDEATYRVEEATPPPTAGQRAGQFASALVGTALLGGIVFAAWSWVSGLGSRDAESLPVFRAEGGPAKIRPDDPGGVATPYQNIQSYDLATGGSRAVGDRAVTLAPAPAGPAAEDRPLGQLAPPPGSDATRTAALAPADPSVRADAGALPEDSWVSSILRSTAPAAALPPAEAATPAEAVIEDEAPGTAAGEEEEEPRVAVVPAPRPRPARPVITRAEPAALPVPLAPQPEAEARRAAETPQRDQRSVDRAAQLAMSAAISPVQIQLGAFTDRSYTEAEWSRISAANRDVLDGRALAIQQHIANGARYYRLRVGPFSDRKEAIRVCNTLKQRGQDCLVATNG